MQVNTDDTATLLYHPLENAPSLDTSCRDSVTDYDIGTLICFYPWFSTTGVPPSLSEVTTSSINTAVAGDYVNEEVPTNDVASYIQAQHQTQQKMASSTSSLALDSRAAFGHVTAAVAPPSSVDGMQEHAQVQVRKAHDLCMQYM